MPTSVMPRGVEHHEQLLLWPPAAGVPTSVMPRGVEHFSADAIAMHEDYACQPP